MIIPIEFDERLSHMAGGASGLDVSATSVHRALIQVAKAYPTFRMFNCDGELRSILRIARNGFAPTNAEFALSPGAHGSNGNGNGNGSSKDNPLRGVRAS